MFVRVSLIAAVLLGGGFSLTAVGHSEFLATVVRHDAQAVLASLPEPLGQLGPSSTVDDLRRAAQQAYVWGWPLVYVHNCRVALEKVPSPGRSGGMPVAPPNQLSMLTDYISPNQTIVPCPNQDVVYGYGILDLGLEPVVVQVPDFGDRFWVYQLGDHRTDGFAEVGKMYGTQPGLYLIVGPDWNGVKPEGIADVFHCPTRVGYCVPRVFLDDTVGDRQAVQPLVNQIMAYPLSRYDGRMKTTDWSKYRWLPQIGNTSGRGSRWVAPETFFDSLTEVLAEVPPLPGEAHMYARFKQLLNLSARDLNVKKLLVQTALQAEETLVAPLFEFRNIGTSQAHHWTTIQNGAAFGTDYLTRTAVAKSNVFVNRNNETKYFYQDLDKNGELLDGAKSYRVTFAADALPPTNGFWSITLYDERHAFHRNELGRFSLGTKNKQLRYNADGSLTIVVQSWAPAADEQANWLPAPTGKFSLYLRLYGPEAPVLTGAWQPPAVVAMNSRPDLGD